MKRVEKTVFISYRRDNIPWALSIYQALTHHGYDAFFDYEGIASGDFEQLILQNIKARAHFLVLLTPSALKRCGDPSDWLRREIETALDTQRNIVPLMLEGFDFATPSISSQLTGKLASLKKYNALRIPADYFDAAMARLREKYLDVPIDTVLHPTSVAVRKTTEIERAAASAAPPVKQRELTAQEWSERGFDAGDLDEQVRCYSEVIRLAPDDASAYYNRGTSRYEKGDLDGALQDFDEAIRLAPDAASAYNNRGNVRRDRNLDGALRDYDEAIRLAPGNAEVYLYRAKVRYWKGDLDGTLEDFDEAIRLAPDDAFSYHLRAATLEEKKSDRAIADFQKYLDLGGGIRYGNQAETEKRIRRLREK